MTSVIIVIVFSPTTTSTLPLSILVNELNQIMVKKKPMSIVVVQGPYVFIDSTK